MQKHLQWCALTASQPAIRNSTRKHGLQWLETRTKKQFKGVICKEKPNETTQTSWPHYYIVWVHNHTNKHSEHNRRYMCFGIVCVQNEMARDFYSCHHSRPASEKYIRRVKKKSSQNNTIHWAELLCNNSVILVGSHAMLEKNKKRDREKKPHLPDIVKLCSIAIATDLGREWFDWNACWSCAIFMLM